MKKSELWAQYVARDPSFAGDGNVTMTACGLRKMFEATWDVAYFDGEMQPEGSYRQHQQNDNVETLKSIFGMK